MIATAEGPVTFLLTIVIAIPDGLSTLIVTTVSWLMSQRMNLNHTDTVSSANTVRPRDTRPQAARTLTMHVFEHGPKNFEMHKFI